MVAIEERGAAISANEALASAGSSELGVKVNLTVMLPVAEMVIGPVWSTAKSADESVIGASVMLELARFAIVTSCIWAAMLAWSGTFEQLLTYVVFVGWIFYALGAAAVIVLRRTRPDVERPFRVPGYPLTPILFVLAAIAIVGNTILTQPKQAAIGLGVVFLGAPAFWFWNRQRPSAEG